MKHNRIPDNEELARRIAVAFDALPGPDEERLEAVRTRLQTQLKGPRSRVRDKGWIWLLLLAGGAATAGWWVGKTLTPATLEEESVVTNPPITKPATTIQEPDSQRSSIYKNEQGTRKDQKGDPIIYQREIQ